MLATCVRESRAEPARHAPAPAAISSPGPIGAQDTFQDVRQAAERGEFAAAAARIERESDPVAAARARVWLEFRARDFDGAQASAEAGLRIEPRDAWLAERALACSLWRRDVHEGRAQLARLESVLSTLPEEQRLPFQEAVNSARSELDSLGGVLRRVEVARSRAQTALAAAGLLLGLLLVTAGWSRRRGA